MIRKTVFPGRRRPLGAGVLADFCRELGTLLRSGIPLSRILEILSEEEGVRAENRRMYKRLLEDIQAGMPLYQAMERQKGVFPPLMVSMFRASESAGNLDQTALRLAEHYKREHRLMVRMKNAMLYPRFLAVLQLVIVALLTGFVLPQFAPLFELMDELPLPTRILYAAAELVTKHGCLIAVGAAAVWIFWKAVSSILFVREKLDQIKVRLPFFGKLFRTIYTARFARTFSSLYAAGVPVLSALEISRKTIGNTYVDRQFDRVIASVKNGNALSEALEEAEGFLARLSAVARIGEESGSLEAMLLSAADALEYDYEAAVNRMVSAFEPAMILVMAVLVGFIMIAVMLPIYGSYNALEELSGLAGSRIRC